MKTLKVNNRTWKRVKWYANSKAPYCKWECWQYKNVVLHPGQWPKEGWSYVRKGNTDHSHSGFLKGFVDLDNAMKRIDELINQGKIVP
jgi:hypothetical protein